MNSITQEAHFRQRVLKYSFKKGVSEAARRYHISRKTIYVWRKRYDGTWKSLVERSHRPHHHPNEHTAEEKEMILRRYPRYKNDLIRLWDSLRKSGYTRSYTSMLRVIRKWVKPEIKKRSARKNQPYQRAEYPGQKVQIDVKYVPTRCVTNGKKYYQYTAIDECTRFCYRELYEEHSTYSSEKFLNNLLRAFPFPIRERFGRSKQITVRNGQPRCARKISKAERCSSKEWNGTTSYITGSGLRPLDTTER